MMAENPAIAHCPCLTADLPGIGGRIKERPEDFVVEEIPLYEPSGAGTHLYLRVEKTHLTTLEVVKRIARTAGRQPRDVGYAGLKDFDAVTRQTLSIEHVAPEVFTGVNLGRLKILSVARHTNKIKLGHLKGNRFEIKLRGVPAGCVEAARRIVDVLIRRGVPNYFGPQRFGARGDNWLIGRWVMLGDWEQAASQILGRPGRSDTGDILTARQLFEQGRWDRAADAWPPNCTDQRRLCRALIRSQGDFRKAWRAVDRAVHRLYLSACQSHLFNTVLARRIDGIDRLMCGDLAYKHANGACFSVEDAAVEQPRCDGLEISPTGPIFGKRMTQPTGEPGRYEANVLAEEGLDLHHFTSVGGVSLDGSRRPLRVPLAQPELDEGSDDLGRYLRLAFALPSGSYATAVTREICKAEEV